MSIFKKNYLGLLHTGLFNVITLIITIISIFFIGIIIVGWFIVVLHVSSYTINTDNSSDTTLCIINPSEGETLQPLIVTSNSSNWIYPNWNESILKFPSGASLDFLCPGRNISINTYSTKKDFLTGICVKGTTFLIENNKTIQWNELRCNGTPIRSIIKTTKKCANEYNGKELEVGFQISDKRFLKFLTICFDFVQEIAFYSYTNLTAAINQQITDNPRPESFITGSGIYTISSPANLYGRTQQRTTINKLLNLPEKSTKYIQQNGDRYLSRGHMIARSDGFYGAEQNATFYLENAAPQWQTLNGRSWNVLESDLRDYAEASGANLQVWCGIYGIATLPDAETGENVELYLFVNETVKALPVPAIYWKVAYNPVAETGVALIGVNNPFIEDLDYLCEDISASLDWFNCKSEQENGYCYACTIPDFREVVDILPDFPVQGLLN